MIWYAEHVCQRCAPKAGRFLGGDNHCQNYLEGLIVSIAMAQQVGHEQTRQHTMRKRVEMQDMDIQG